MKSYNDCTLSSDNAVMIHILSQLATRETLAPGRTQIEDNVAKPFSICMRIIPTIHTIGINCKKQYNGHTSYIYIHLMCIGKRIGLHASLTLA